MSQEVQKHPLENYPESDRVAYLSILAAVCYVDKDFTIHEKEQIDNLLTQLGISDEGKSEIYSSIFNSHHEDKLINIAAIQQLENTELKYTLISDLCLIAISDSNICEQEYQYILEIASYLGISHEQVDAIRVVQEKLRMIEGIPPKSDQYRDLLREMASKLASVGVPVAAIAASGSFGLSAAGITSGLAFLGGLVGGGMLMGTVFVVPALAVGSAYGVKKLFDIVWKNKEQA